MYMIDVENIDEMKNLRILFTEGKDPRMLNAAARLKEEGLLIPVLFGELEEIAKVAKDHQLDVHGIEIINPTFFKEREAMLKRMLELRKGKADRATVESWYTKDSYFCTMYVEMGFADGLLGGSTNSTADTLRPIMQLVKTSPGNTFVSSCFIMNKGNQHLVFADCSLNRNPDVDHLVEIALQTAENAKTFGISPRVAMLSYSTKGSGLGPDIERVKEASKRLLRMPLDYPVDGEMQVDCALVERVAQLKAPDSVVGGTANVLIFPDLNAANIGYKLVANLGGYEALGPILQGVRLPMNDLSRSATADEIYKMALITAMQALTMR